MIKYFPNKGSTPEKAIFSILIPTWNNLSYLKLCVESIQKNSSYSHEIIIHVNDGRDGTLDWVKEQGFSYTWSQDNVGICWALNASASIAQTDYILYINDDMYACPQWDQYLYENIQSVGHDYFFLSATMIEPTLTDNPAVIGTLEFGNSIETFREDLLLEKFSKFERPDWSGATGAPNIVTKRLWNLVGGYSIEFSPGMASDPDFSMKLWQAGVRYFQGVSKSRAFHFQCKTTGRVQRNDGRRQFMRKWRMASSSFVRWFIRKGEQFDGHLPEANPPWLCQLKDSIRCHW